jgi:tRNA A37 methylthiotransferase MiaB
MLAQQEIAFSQNQRRVGEVCRVVIDGRERGQWLARSHGEAPEIDPRILLQDLDGGDRNTSSLDWIGRFQEVKITGTRNYDLFAHPIQQED